MHPSPSHTHACIYAPRYQGALPEVKRNTFTTRILRPIKELQRHLRYSSYCFQRCRCKIAPIVKGGPRSSTKFIGLTMQVAEVGHPQLGNVGCHNSSSLPYQWTGIHMHIDTSIGHEILCRSLRPKRIRQSGQLGNLKIAREAQKMCFSCEEMGCIPGSINRCQATQH
jgi:hypothetical protein